MLSAFKILILIPNILIVVNVNYLFTMFVLNSLCLIISNYHMHCKADLAMYNDKDKQLKFSLLLALRLFLLFMIVMWSMYPVYGLTCFPDPYPSQLAAIAYLDFFNAATDLIITCRMPRNLTRIVTERKLAGSTLGGFEPPEVDDEVLAEVNK